MRKVLFKSVSHININTVFHYFACDSIEQPYVDFFEILGGTGITKVLRFKLMYKIYGYEPCLHQLI